MASKTPGRDRSGGTLVFGGAIVLGCRAVATRDRSPFSLHRRALLKAGGAALGALALPRCGSGEPPIPTAPPEPEPNDGATELAFAPAQIPEDLARFAIGVQAGEMTATGALLLTHIQDEAPARLRVWRDSELPGHVKMVHERELTGGGFVKAELEGLGPGHYRYAFFDASLERRSPIGSFRTAFGPGDLRPLRIAGITCTNARRRPFTALERTATLGADLICHLGDMSYNDDVTTLQEYRASWRETLSDPGYVAALGSAGLYATWDDHEFGKSFDAERMMADAPEQLAAAKDAFYETVAVRRTNDDRLWRSHRWGATAEIFVLDSRTERRSSTRTTDHPIYLGEAQMAWLKQALTDSPCHFKIVLNSVPMTEVEGLWNVGLADRWQGYAAQRQELLDFLVSRSIPRTIFLSGDFHCGFVARLDPNGPGRNLYEVAVGPTAPYSPNPLAILADSGDLPREDVFPADRFVFGTGAHRAVTTLDLDPLRDTARVRFEDARPSTAGQVLFDSELVW